MIMSSEIRIVEHESVEWILKNIPKFSKGKFLKKFNVIITAFDVNVDIVVVGTNNGNIYVINRKTNLMENVLLKKDCEVCQLKIIRTVDVSIAVGCIDGSIYILTIPLKDVLVFHEISQFVIPGEHKAAISCMTWSKNAEKLFSGDIFGFVFCVEINYQNKTISAYEICKTASKINQMAYDHKCLLISNDTETFMWNCSNNKRIQIGSRPRNEQGKFGVSFINKLCKIEEMETIIVRPGGKIWISDSKGFVKKSIVFKSDLIFEPDKLISLLPSVTSQSNNTFVNDIQSGKIRFQFGLVLPINESEMLFWSENFIVTMNIITGNILSSTYNLGKIISVSICDINHLQDTNSNKCNTSNAKKLNQCLYEIWVFRKPLCENDNKLVRLSSLPLLTSKLQVDFFYFFSPQKIVTTAESLSQNKTSACDHSVMMEATDESSDADTQIPISNTSNKTDTNTDSWFSKLGTKTQNIDVIETINEMRSNVIEKTKGVMKQALFTDEDEEGLEQAIELTENGLMINFDNTSLPLDSNISNPCDKQEENFDNIVISNPNLRVKLETRKIAVINLEESADLMPNQDVTLRDRDNNIWLSELYKNKLSVESTDSETFSNSYIGNSFNSSSFNVLNNMNQVSEERTFKGSDNFDDSDSDSFINDDTLLSNADGLENNLTGSVKNMLLNNQNSINQMNLSGESLKETEVIPNIVDSSPISSDGSDKQLTETVQCDTKSIECIDYENSEQNQNLEENIENVISDTPENINEKSVINIFDYNDGNNAILPNSVLAMCNRWISHRGPNLPNNAKVVSISINRRMIWLTDSKGLLHFGFQNLDQDSDTEKSKDNYGQKIIWYNEPAFRTDKISSSPNGYIMWRERNGEVSVYTGVSKILTSKVVKERVLQKSNWEVAIQDVKEIDVDEEMAIVVTKGGQLKIIDGISSRTPYKQCKSVNIQGNVTLATTFNGIIWCVTEINMTSTLKPSQHIFACLAKDDDGNFDCSYWRTVPIAKDLVTQNEQNFGCLGGSESIKSVKLGVNNLAWILTLDNMCFFCQDISPSNLVGDGIWYQISFHYILQEPSYLEEGIMYLSAGIQKVEKLFGYSDGDPKLKKCSSNILMSVKCPPKNAKGNGLLWITSVERNAPCILFESEKSILGHHWFDCFSNQEIARRNLVGLPAVTQWSYVEIAVNNTLWLLHKSGELFCYWSGNKIRTVFVPSFCGKITKIAAFNTVVTVLTSKSKILIRLGITNSNPMGTEWTNINKDWNQNEAIKDISCSDNEIWVITESNVYYNEDLKSLIVNKSKHLPWNLLNFKMKDSSSKKLHFVQNSNFQDVNYLWAISDPDGFIYMSVWQLFKNEFTWTYIPGPRAKSIHVSGENLWIIEQTTGNIFLRCGIDRLNEPMGQHWIHVPIVTKHVLDLAVTSKNEVFVIDILERLLFHKCSVIDRNKDLPSETNTTLADFAKPDDQDWEFVD